MSATRDWTGQEAVPAGSDFIASGDDSIRNGKVDIRERAAVDHVWGTSVSLDGYHNKVTLYPQVSDPATIATMSQLYGKTVSSKDEIFIRDQSGNIYQLTSNGKLNALMLDGVVPDANITNCVLLAGDQTVAGSKTLSGLTLLTGGCVLENRTNDTGCTQTGRIWFRTDI